MHAEVSNKVPSQMHRNISKFPILGSYSTPKFKRIEDMKLGDGYSDVIRIYCSTVQLLVPSMGYYITVNYSTILLQRIIWNVLQC